MELGGKKVPRGSALRGSSRASSADVRSNHGGRCVSVASSEDRGPRRFFASFSSYYTGLSVSRSVPPISKKRFVYHMNVFGRPPVLPRVIGILRWSFSSVYQAGEVGHRSAEQRFVAVATFEYAHDATLGPLVGKCTDVLCESIEK